jgi:hypothetical protein
MEKIQTDPLPLFLLTTLTIKDILFYENNIFRRVDVSKRLRKADAISAPFCPCREK